MSAALRLSDEQKRALVEAARSFVGTPFHHQGRTPHVGLDCIGLVVAALAKIGVSVEDRTDYSPRPDGTTLVASIVAHGAEPASDIETGSLLVFRFDQQPQHVAIAISDRRMVHSFAPAGKVIESEIGAYWRRRLVAIYDWPKPQEG